MKIALLAFLLSTNAFATQPLYPEHTNVKIIAGVFKGVEGTVVGSWPCKPLRLNEKETFCYMIQTPETEFIEYFSHMHEEELKKI